MVRGGQPDGPTGDRGAFTRAAVRPALVPAVRQPGSRIGGFAAGVCVHHERDARPPQLHQVVHGTDQLEFSLRPCPTTQREAAEAASPDLPDDPFHGDLSLRVDCTTTLSAQTAPHPIRHAEAFRDAPARRPGHRSPVTTSPDGYVGLEGTAVALLQGP